MRSDFFVAPTLSAKGRVLYPSLLLTPDRSYGHSCALGEKYRLYVS